jgi:hypothetical protein
MLSTTRSAQFYVGLHACAATETAETVTSRIEDMVLHAIRILNPFFIERM